MRLGNTQEKTYIAGVVTSAVTGSAVVIDVAGRLGTQLSSARYKRDIEPMGTRSAGVLEVAARDVCLHPGQAGRLDSTA